MIFTSLCVLTQNISVEDDCLLVNSALLSNALIELKGDEFTEKLLDDNFGTTMIFEVDMSGRVLALVRMVRTYEKEIELGEELAAFLMKKGICFNICYVNEVQGRKEEVLERIIQNIEHENKTTFFISIGFLQTKPWLYEAHNQNLGKEGKIGLSKVEYLKLQIEKYLTSANKTPMCDKTDYNSPKKQGAAKSKIKCR